MRLVKPVGKCPECQSTLQRVGHDGPKGRYSCTNVFCHDRFRKSYNRAGERR